MNQLKHYTMNDLVYVIAISRLGIES